MARPATTSVTIAGYEPDRPVKAEKTPGRMLAPRKKKHAARRQLTVIGGARIVNWLNPVTLDPRIASSILAVSTNTYTLTDRAAESNDFLTHSVFGLPDFLIAAVIS